ncbi:gamma-glutamylcyclotransferase [Candidatus Pacearchaeota archaeon]|nr:gamma-glutamylcyclotransferase [Candidatus Pacearchaeota archaeon]
MGIEKKLAFVYGSLLSGGEGKREGAFGNHRVIEDAKFLGEHITDSDYTMLSLGGFPGVIENGDISIIGEVYEVTDEIFARLDMLEGYPTFYGRKQIKTAYGTAWIYLLPNGYLNKYAKVASGNWRTK